MFKNMNVKQIERIMVLGLVIFFLFWMARQCARSANSDKMQPIPTAEEIAAQTPTTTTAPVTTTPATVQNAVRRDTVVQTQYVNRPTTLFVWTEGLKVRSEPYLTSSIVVELPINAQLNFENETSAFKQKIKLDNIEYDERWLKIKTTDGKTGWVYGGGVRLYQK